MKVNHNEIFKYYQIGIYPSYEKLYVFGDIHGDFNAFINVLKKAKLIDNDYHWCGGNAHVVQVGDILDRKIRTNEESDEDSEFIILDWIMKLKIQAFHSGGAFHTIMGNHEIMNVMGIFDYVSPLGLRKFNNNPSLRKEYFKIGGSFCKILSQFWNPIIKINHYLFCHGGLTANISTKYNINEINNLMRTTLFGNENNFKSSFFYELFLHENGILWNRHFSMPSDSPYYNHALNQELNTIFLKYNVSCLIIGHTVQENGIRYNFNNKVICIDTGMSEAFGKKKNKMERIQHIVIHPMQNKILISARMN